MTVETCPGQMNASSRMSGESRMARIAGWTNPDAPFVEAGGRVAAGSPVCIIEVMKLFNTVNAAVGGTIVEVLAENGAMVEYNQLLFVLQPDA